MENNTIKFSVGIPAFKGKFFEECIGSILKQTYTNFELIIVDDNSPDNLLEIVEKFKDPRISYFKNEYNTGAEKVVNNWNKAVEKASGDFFILMGDDDRMEEDYLESFAGLINKYPDLDVYHCRSKIIDDHGKELILTASWPEYEDVYDNIWHRITLKRYQYISDFVYRLDALKKRGGYYYLPLAWGSDDISAFIACGEKGIAHTNKPVFNYRSNQLSITSTGNIEKKLEANYCYYKWLKEFLEENQKRSDKTNVVMLNDLSRNYESYLRKRGRGIMSKSLKNHFFKSSLLLLRCYRKYNLSFTDLTLIILAVIKQKISN